MKVYISDGNKQIENFHNIKIDNVANEMQDIVPNSCELIVLDGTLENIIAKNLKGFLTLMNSKLRKGGKLTINGIDALNLAMNFVDGTITSLQFSEIVQGKACLMSSYELKGIIESLNMRIESLTIRGLQYELIATR